jgi:hypothetical protein
MMFMIPMPPITRQIVATAPSSLDIRLVVAVRVLMISAMLRTLKSSSAPGWSLCRCRNRAAASPCT